MLGCLNADGVLVTKTVEVAVSAKPIPAPVEPAPTVKPSTTTVATNQTTKLTASDGEKVSNAAVEPTVSQDAVLDPTNITDTTKEKAIEKVEYYRGEEILQTDSEAPYVMDTTKLKDGSYTITERTYFEDGSTAETTRTIEIANVSQKTATDNNSGSLLWLALIPILLVGGLAVAFAIRRRGSTAAYTAPDTVTYAPHDYSPGVPDWQRGLKPQDSDEPVVYTQEKHK